MNEANVSGERRRKATVTEMPVGTAKRRKDPPEAQLASEGVVTTEEDAAREGLTAPEVLALALVASLALIALLPILLVLAII